MNTSRANKTAGAQPRRADRRPQLATVAALLFTALSSTALATGGISGSKLATPCADTVPKARMEFEGQVYQDVLEAGFETTARSRPTEDGATRYNGWKIIKEREPQWQIHRDRGDVLVRVRNPWMQPVEVELSLIGPMEIWGEDAGEYGLASLGPAHVGLTIPARGEQCVRFPLLHSGPRAPRFTGGTGRPWHSSCPEERRLPA